MNGCLLKNGSTCQIWNVEILCWSRYSEIRFERPLEFFDEHRILEICAQLYSDTFVAQSVSDVAALRSEAQHHCIQLDFFETAFGRWLLLADDDDVRSKT